MIYILVQKSDKKAIGIFSSEAIARNNAVEGEYLIIPLELDRRYDAGIINEAMMGAFTVKATATDLTEYVQQIKKAIIGINETLDSLDARITALET